MVWHSFSAFLSLQVLVLCGYQGGLKASLMSEDSTYSCKVLHPLLVRTNMNKVRTAITEQQCPSCQKKALFEKITWGSCWLFAQSSTTRRGLLKEDPIQDMLPFMSCPQGHVQWELEGTWASSRRDAQHSTGEDAGTTSLMPEANCLQDVTLGVSPKTNIWNEWMKETVKT